MTPLTLLYAPGDRPDVVRKALASSADVVQVDLEDAVVPAHKDQARIELAQLAPELARRSSRVRVNGLGTSWYAADIQAVGALPLSVGVVVPKAESPTDVACLAEALPGRAIYLLIESALGLTRINELAHISGVASIGLGEADLRADLGCDEAGLAYPRSLVIVAARTAGLSAPSMSVYPDIRDLAGLAASCAIGRALGFRGRAAIHPAQLPVIREAFLPTPAEVDQARAVMECFQAASREGQGAAAMPDGTFLDEAVVRRARCVLQFADERKNHD